MAGRMSRADSISGRDSSMSSTGAMGSVMVNKNLPHPESWTLPQEWNMEVREKFGEWKKDVQNQIVNMGMQLDSSLKEAGEDGLYKQDLTDTQRRRILEQDVKAFTYTVPAKVGCRCKTFF